MYKKEKPGNCGRSHPARLMKTQTQCCGFHTAAQDMHKYNLLFPDHQILFEYFLKSLRENSVGDDRGEAQLVK